MIEFAIKDYLERVTGKKVTPAFSTAPFPSVSYKLSPIGEGAVKTSQLEVRVAGDALDDVLELRNKIIENLYTDEQKPSIVIDKYAIRAEVSGGGWLFDSETNLWEYPTFFTITWRCL